jgi:putative restriction endonuclease
MGPQGIFKPRVLELPLSITTAPEGPYEDAFVGKDLLRYRYRGTDPGHRDNVGLREVMVRGLPLVYFFGIDRNKYMPQWPAFVIGDDPGVLAFTVQVDDIAYVGADPEESVVAEGRRAYITAAVRRRVHQRSFSERVLRAYQERCAICLLRHKELLDATHIVPDAEPEGEPKVANGLALCKLHHAAFDALLLGIRPDYLVEVRRDVLEEEDGPMLRHGLQGIHRSRIHHPRREDLRPDPRLLGVKFERFLAAGR